MIPGSFSYHRPATLADALTLLSTLGDEVRPLAGGHSLVPMMKLRLATPEHLVDLHDIADLKGVRRDGGRLLIGAMPTAVETPHWETDFTVTPSPHHPIGAKGVGESPNVGGVPCFSNAVNDAFAFLGSTNIAMPHDNWRTWTAADKLGLHR